MLTLLETAAQVHWFAHHSPGSHVLAVTPEAAYTCQKLGQPYLKLEDHARVPQRLTEYTTILPCYLEWEGWLDHWAQEIIPEFGEAGFKPAADATFLLQLLFAEIWATTVSLREFLQAVQPAQVALWPPVIVDVPWYLHPQISSLSALMPSIAHAYDIPVTDLSTQAPDLAAVSLGSTAPTGPKRLMQLLKSRLLRHPTAICFVVMRHLGLMAPLRQFASNSPRILFSGYGYDLMPLARELYRQGTRVTLLPDTFPPVNLTQSASLPAKLRAALLSNGKRLLEEPELWRPLEQWGLERIPLWSKPLSLWWHKIVPELWLNFRCVQHLLNEHKFAALVTWDTTGTTLSSAAANAAATAKVSRFVYQHGSSSGSDAKLWQSYLRHSETFLAYGQGTVEELYQTCPQCVKPCAQVIPVGSARLDLVRRGHPSEKSRQLRAQLQAGDARPVIMYVPTSFNGYGRAISDLAAYPDVSYFELQQSILTLWLEAPGVRLLYKDFIVASDLNRVMRDFIRVHIPDAIITTQRLTDLMWAVDAIVVDHVITAAGEVLLTNKPLVFYMPRPDMANSQAKAKLQKRAAVAETPVEFMAEVRALLQRGQYPELEHPDTEFLQTYCIHIGDGRSAERAASIVLQKRAVQS